MEYPSLFTVVQEGLIVIDFKIYIFIVMCQVYSKEVLSGVTSFCLGYIRKCRRCNPLTEFLGFCVGNGDYVGVRDMDIITD